MAFCGNCGTQVAGDVAFCPNCGKAVTPVTAELQPPTPVANTSAPASAPMPLEENIAGMLAYFTIIPAILFLLIDPYNRNRFVRFHSFQCIFAWIAWIVICVALSIVSAVLHLIPVLGWIIATIMWPLVGLAGLVLWLLLVIKAYQHQIYKLPVVGDMAQKQTGV